MKINAKKAILSGLLLLAIASAMVVLARIPMADTREAIQEWISDAGRWGMLWYFLIGTALSVVFFPITPIILSGGLLFGFKIGLGLALAVLACGSMLGFLLGGKIWDRISHFSFARNRWFQAIHLSIREDGAITVALLRMTPFIQFSLANFFFGTLSIRLLPFTVASLIGMLPGACLMVYAGTLARSAFGSEDDLGAWQWALFAVGIGIFIFVSIRVTAKAREHFKKLSKEDSEAQEEVSS